MFTQFRLISYLAVINVMLSSTECLMNFDGQVPMLIIVKINRLHSAFHFDMRGNLKETLCSSSKTVNALK